MNAAREVSRRRFLVATAVTGGAVATAACTSRGSSGGESESLNRPVAAHADVQMIASAASLENLLVVTYQGLVDGAVAGKFGAVPAATLALVQTARRHHRDHANAWNALLADAGHPRVSDSDPQVAPTINQRAAQLHDPAALAHLVLDLEGIVAATSLQAVGGLQNLAAVRTAATIHPVEMQHVAIVNFLLGQFPAPETFARTDAARPPTDEPLAAK